MVIHSKLVGVRLGDDDFNRQLHSYVQHRAVGYVSFRNRVFYLEAMLPSGRSRTRLPGDERAR